MGSSPLARGPRSMARFGDIVLGLIPARAGTTIRRLPYPPRPRAHPRSRGDHFQISRQNSTVSGSSPLARGPPPVRIPEWVRTGLIPARAGTTPAGNVHVVTHGAHPRSRGDHSPTQPRASYRPGSSPLARGPRMAGVAVGAVGGLIPARAGTTKTTT